MTLTKLNPYGDLVSLHDKVNRLFDSELRGLTHSANESNTWYPAADVYETKDDYVFKLEVPGLSKDDVNVEFNNHVLSIKGEKKENKEINKEDYHRIESYRGAFSRSFTLPKDVDSTKITASMKDGILVLRIPKAEEKKAKSIAIDVN
jgi:HSP20 family protein